MADESIADVESKIGLGLAQQRVRARILDGTISICLWYVSLGSFATGC